MGLRSNLIRRYVQSPLIQERYSASYRGIENPFLGADSGAIRHYASTPYKPAPQLSIFINLTPLLLWRSLRTLSAFAVMVFQSVRGSRSGYTAMGTLENLRETLLAILPFNFDALYDSLLYQTP